jgi:hypothetical protein
MITLIVIVAVVWTVIRIVQFVGYLWNLANAPRIGIATAT